MRLPRLKPVYRRWLKRLGIAAAATGLLACALVTILWHLYPFPVAKLERWPASPVVCDREGTELLALVGRDEQWRRPVPLSRMSPWLIQATLAVEDERFFSHPGVDVLAVLRAAGQNTWGLRRVSGASTLTMQICRMMDNRPRKASAKVVEAFRSLQLERIWSKDRILEFYLNTAPYGGNIRGVEAAARAYFRKSAADLSLGEAALLAGLPQSPSRLRPDRHGERAARRRAHVLERMSALGMIRDEQSELALAEPLPRRRYHDNGQAPHAAWMALRSRPQGGRITLDLALQAHVEALTREFASRMPRHTQVAAVAIDVASGDIAALSGSVDRSHPAHGAVNGVLGRRSPGSALKPFIYAAAMEAGVLGPDTVVYDVPVDRGGWSPANFDGRFAGPLPAADALRRSLNVPAILVAQAVGVPRCIGIIESAGVRLPARTREDAGLAVVTGATEVTLLDLVNGYATLARGGVYRPARLFGDEPAEPRPAIGSNVCAAIDDVLSSRRRRPQGMEARGQESVPWFMWKTGTSSGRRDAWAVGHNRRYAIGVWVGRFSGAAAHEYVGALAAEPLLAALFDLPAIRTNADPPAPAPLLATRPLSPPPEVAGPLRILSPGAGARFIAVQGAARIYPHANRVERLAWFLNGTLLSSDKPIDGLTLTAGTYELRCVDASGSAAHVRFSVLAEQHGARPNPTGG